MNSDTQNLWWTTLLFGLMGFVGPLIRWVTWPPSALEQKVSVALNDFVYDLVLMLWPAQMLAVIEVNIGTDLAIVVAVGFNILLFSFIGVLVGILVKGTVGLSVFYIAIVLFVSLLHGWFAGFSMEYLNILALIVALLVYAVPFVLKARFLQ